MRSARGAIAGTLGFVCLWLAPTTPPGHAAYPGASGKLAFTTDRSGAPEVYSLNPYGDGPWQRLATAPAEDAAWSPDGTRLAYVHREGDNLEIYVANADGSAARNVTMHPAADGLPSWSPDGERIAFTSTRGGDLNVYTMSADGSEVVRLTADRAADSNSAWSPDGSRIAFASNRASSTSDIYTMNPDGSGVRRLTEGLTPFPLALGNSQPAWSPDGRQIAFTSDRDRSGPYINVNIYVMNADGSDETRLTEEPGYDQDPAFAPDGSSIAFASSRTDGWLDLYTMKKNGSGVTRLTAADAYHDHQPDWQPLVHGPRCKYIERGGMGRDTLRGTRFSDALFGRRGGDGLFGAQDPDCLDGERGSDRLRGGRGADELTGGPGRDSLIGGKGADVVSAADGRTDRVNCGPGDDAVRADRSDALRGCEEADPADASVHRSSR